MTSIRDKAAASAERSVELLFGERGTMIDVDSLCKMKFGVDISGLSREDKWLRMVELYTNQREAREIRGQRGNRIVHA